MTQKLQPESEHTPLPWVLFESNGIISITDGKKRTKTGAREIIKWTGFDGSDYPEHVEANARLIGRAVNSYPGLREALMESADIGEGSGTLNSLPHIAKIARKALATGEAGGG